MFHDLVRAKDYKRLDLLLKEDVVYAPYRNVELLWAASHSKRMFNRLLKVKTIPENEPPCIDKWEDALKADVIDGWRTLPFSELKWSKAAVRTILSDGVYSTLYLSASSSLLSSAVSDNSQEGIARLRAYVEVLGLDLHEGKKESESRPGADQNLFDEDGLPKRPKEGVVKIVTSSHRFLRRQYSLKMNRQSNICLNMVASRDTQVFVGQPWVMP